MNFDAKKWEQKIQKPDWYFDFAKEYEEFRKRKISLSAEEIKAHKVSVYDFFEKHLREGNIALGETGKNFDAERKPVDTVVIHHTHLPPGLSTERLSAVTLLRLYTSFYANPEHKTDFEIWNKPIHSGHFQNGKQVFYPYHWIIRNDGTAERLLNDNEIGWHAGNWNLNCRSVAIVLDNNYEDSEPSKVELHAIADIIKNQYPGILLENVVGHREINQKTTCPSNVFLGGDGWKRKLLDLMQNG